jgi:uncharacterized protein DUF6353
MRLVPHAISRKIAEQTLLTKKNSPTILLGAGVVSMVGSTALACRATLKLEDVLSEIEENMSKAHRAKEMVEAGIVSEGTTYSDHEMKQDIVIIYVRGAAKIAKLYAPSLILGAAGVVCLTKSHKILQERNSALTAAYVAVDTAFKAYRQRVVDRYGEEIGREFRYGAEHIDIINEDTGEIASVVRVEPGEPSGYARWFDEENNNWHPSPYETHNFLWLRTQQNWANDMLRARGHLFLNEVYSLIGLTHTSAGAIVGWVYDRHNDRGDNYVDFGCWGDDFGQPLDFFNGRDGAILLDFNVDGPIWDLIDKRNAETEREERERES